MRLDLGQVTLVPFSNSSDLGQPVKSGHFGSDFRRFFNIWNQDTNLGSKKLGCLKKIMTIKSQKDPAFWVSKNQTLLFGIRTLFSVWNPDSCLSRFRRFPDFRRLDFGVLLCGEKGWHCMWHHQPTNCGVCNSLSHKILIHSNNCQFLKHLHLGLGAYRLYFFRLQ